MAESKEHAGKMGEVISKAWSDEAFKVRLLTDTMAALKENGIAVPEGVSVRVVENTDKLFHLVIPPRPEPVQLSDDDLNKVAGGGGEWCMSGE